jgi:hypothetical protein
MTMESIDERIRKALSTEDQAILAELDSHGTLFGEVTATFSGQRRWFNVAGWLAGLLMLAVAVTCGWQFFTQPDLRVMQMWGAGLIISVLALGLVKLWFFLELQRTAILREIKRVELQVAGIAAAMRDR